MLLILDIAFGSLGLIVGLTGFLLDIGLFWRFKRIGKGLLGEAWWLINAVFVSVPILMLIVAVSFHPDGMSALLAAESLLAVTMFAGPFLFLLCILIAARFFNPLPVPRYENLDAAEKEPWSFDPNSLRFPMTSAMRSNRRSGFPMEEIPMSVHGTVHWTELNTHDAEKAKKFYGETMGWTFDGMPMGDGATYYLCVADGETVAGIFTMTDPMFAAIPEHWFSYFAVADVDALVEKARLLGATILREPFDVPGTGRVAIVQSPSGSVCGWMTPVSMQESDNPGEMEYGIHD